MTSFNFIICFRYDKAVDPNEDSHDITNTVDQYGFAVLVDDVYHSHKDGRVLTAISVFLLDSFYLEVCLSHTTLFYR